MPDLSAVYTVSAVNSGERTYVAGTIDFMTNRLTLRLTPTPEFMTERSAAHVGKMATESDELTGIVIGAGSQW